MASKDLDILKKDLEKLFSKWKRKL
jgi:hypothetical protein